MEKEIKECLKLNLDVMIYSPTEPTLKTFAVRVSDYTVEPSNHRQLEESFDQWDNIGIMLEHCKSEVIARRENKPWEEMNNG